MTDPAVTATVDEHAASVRDFVVRFFQVIEAADSSGIAAFYHHQLAQLCAAWRTIVVRWDDFLAFDPASASSIQANYLRSLQPACEGLTTFIRSAFPDKLPRDVSARLAFIDVPNAVTVRLLRSTMVGELCSISGTVTRTSQVRPELLVGVFRCNDCGTDSEPIEQQFRYTEPPRCRAAECENKRFFSLVADSPMTVFGDWQKLRVQESANAIPVGCMPRTLEVIVRDDMVEVAKPGDSVILSGCAVVVPEVSKLFSVLDRREVQRSLSGAQREMLADNNLEGATGLKALGVRDLNYKLCFLAQAIQGGDGDSRIMLDAAANLLADQQTHSTTDAPLSDEEVALVARMRSTPGILPKLAKCVCPRIIGHDLIKTGLLLQLAGGVSKRALAGTQLRGDINICIVGDPSTAKSQFLKWIASTVPRGIFTSGKASTASGLTATLTRDVDTGERTIEAGALMLADHGVCCIDEFDKMDIKDQVAIHEAMEQQTISIAKAGVKATLSARTALLAALNPIGGKYDRKKPLQKNIAMTAPIMSRFDLMFVVVDDGDESADVRLADGVLKLHQTANEALRSPFAPSDFSLYIRAARRMHPRMSPEASEKIAQDYVGMRVQDSLANRSKVFRVTTRLLESVIRLSEAAAKLMMSESVGIPHVDIALEVMRASLTTLDMSEVEFDDFGGGEENADSLEHRDREAIKEMTRAEAAAEKRTRRKVTININVFNRVAGRLLARVRQLGDNHPTVEDLISWYLGQLQLDDVEGLQVEGRTARLVLSKLRSDGKLLSIDIDGVHQLFIDPNLDPVA